MGNATRKSAKIFTAAALLIALCLALAPSAAWAASIGTSADITATNAVYFGAYEQDDPADGKDPVEWRVLEKTSGQLFLLSEKNLDAKPYDKDNAYTAVTWETSTIRAWLNGYTANQAGASVLNPYADSFAGTAFGSKERAAIANTAVVNDDNPIYPSATFHNPGGNDTTDKIFFLSIQEVATGTYGYSHFTSNSAKIARNTAYAISQGAYDSSGDGDWWLRSPGVSDDYAADVYADGYVHSDGPIVGGGSLGVRPAFKLNLSSVILTSAAAGGKSAFGSGSLEDASTPTGAIKLTVLDDAQTLEVTATTAQSAQSGGALSFGYRNATTGARQFVSCVLELGGAVKYYGKLADSSGAASGTLSIPLSGVANGTYTLKIFSERDNGDNRTDFASAPVTMRVTVTGTAGNETGTASDFNGTIDDSGNPPGGSGGGCIASFGFLSLALTGILVLRMKKKIKEQGQN